ncbi:hypothetical protein FM106_09950 [Brachybacterium faecium]|nr:hypothetical protein FM106_09950 [Brachybacterium faecium]
MGGDTSGCGHRKLLGKGPGTGRDGTHAAKHVGESLGRRSASALAPRCPPHQGFRPGGCQVRANVLGNFCRGGAPHE